MLVLSRGKNQSIIIDDHIEITIVEIKPDQIKIGIQAPKNVKINRKEVYEKIKSEMMKAATSRIPRFDQDQNSDSSNSISESNAGSSSVIDDSGS